jgi:hypothetical protein
MVDFRKRLANKAAIKPVDPIEIYDRLDRAHDKGPLRPSQEAILRVVDRGRHRRAGGCPRMRRPNPRSVSHPHSER